MTISTRALRDAHAKTTPGKWQNGRTPFLGVVIARNTAVAQECTEHDLAFIVIAHERWNEMLDALDDRPPLSRMFESGTRIVRCGVCGTDNTEMHTWKECAEQSAAHDLATVNRLVDFEIAKNAEVESLRAEVARLKSRVCCAILLGPCDCAEWKVRTE